MDDWERTEKLADIIRQEQERKRTIRKKREEGNLPSRILGSAKRRAKDCRLPFNLTIEDITVPAICPILGHPLVPGIGTLGYNSPSIDKIIPSLGYVRGNVQIISMRANMMKNDATPEELVLFAKWVQRTYPEMF